MKIIKLENTTDELLMQRVSMGELDYLNPLFQRYHIKLYNFFLRLTGDEASSKDLVQNLFLRIMKYKHSYKSNHKFKTWIYQMARNLFYDFYKEQQKISFQQVDIADIEPPDSPRENLESDQENEEKLFVAMQKLSMEKRELLVMSKFQNMRYEEIAAITATSVANVKVKVHRALNNLREIYFQIN